MLVCIDVGHAKNTAGKRSFDGSLLEYEFNRVVARFLKNELERYGVRTMYSCDINTAKDISLSERCRAANNAKADLFISIHANAYGSTWNSANGWEIYHHANSTNGKRLAEAIHKTSIPTLELRDRGIKTSNFTVLTGTKMPAVLIEHGFYTNKEECEKLKDVEFCKKCAVADAEGILNYLGIKKELTAPDDIIRELSKQIEIKEVDKAVKALEKAKNEDSSLYWILYKIVNS